MPSEHNNFNLLRLILALLVVLGHFRLLPGAAAHGVFAYADLAVDAFFVISGYLVFASFENRPRVAAFYIRRLARIYPLYAVTVIAQGLGMAVLAGGIGAHAGELLRYLAYNLAMANFMAYDIGGLLAGLPDPGINPSLWTLKIEVAFYAILPLLWWFARRRALLFLVLIYVASTLYVALALYYGADIPARQLPGQLRFFAVGMGLYMYRDRALRRPAGLLALGLFVLCSWRNEAWLMPVYPLVVGLLVFICALRLPVVALPFDISYGVYLFHGPLIQFSLLLGVFSDTGRFFLLLLATVVALALAADWLVERPFIVLGRRLSRRVA